MDLNNMIINSNNIITIFLDIDFKQTPFFIILSNKIKLKKKKKKRKLNAKELMLLNCGVGKDSWESLGLQADPTSPF